jgi:prevent-host-death family protein
MMQVNMLKANTKLAKLVDAAEHGEEVVISRNGIPVAKIVPIPKKMNFGFLKGKIKPVDDSLLFAMSDEEADRFINGEE